MPIRKCLFLLTVIALLAFAPAASAHHHWHGDDWDNQDWNPPTAAGPR